MALKDILVHLDNSNGSDIRLDLAIAFAVRHGAHLRGLYVLSHAHYEPRHIKDQEDMESVESMFARKSAEAGISSEWVSVDWAVTGVSITEIVNLHAYYADLVVVGQTDYSSPDRSVPADLPERLVLAAGRPVLIVPYAGTFTNAGDRVMVAWKAGREATRAVNDAMPCLREANHVAVVGVSATGGADESTTHFEELSAHLAHHGVKAHCEMINAGNFPIGDMILNRTCEEKIDLLVMGAYAHTRRGTLDLSPVARHILKHLTVPILMSH